MVVTQDFSDVELNRHDFSWPVWCQILQSFGVDKDDWVNTMYIDVRDAELVMKP